jgi:hypothetical protein
VGRLREAEHERARGLLAARRVDGRAVGHAVEDDVLLQRAVGERDHLAAVVGVPVGGLAVGAVALLIFSVPADPVARRDGVAGELDVVEGLVLGGLRERRGRRAAGQRHEDDGRRRAGRRRAGRRRGGGLGGGGLGGGPGGSGGECGGAMKPGACGLGGGGGGETGGGGLGGGGLGESRVACSGQSQPG